LKGNEFVVQLDEAKELVAQLSNEEEDEGQAIFVVALPLEDSKPKAKSKKQLREEEEKRRRLMSSKNFS
jgi:hypothetical protein